MEAPLSSLRITSLLPHSQCSIVRHRGEVLPNVEATLTVESSCQTERISPTVKKEPPNPMTVRESGFSAEPGDPPLLQRPIQTPGSAIQQIIECFRSGTSRLRHILLREVDTIFECKLCRSLFRGLTNLVTHKEFYCFHSLPHTDASQADELWSQTLNEPGDTTHPQGEGPGVTVNLEPLENSSNAVLQFLSQEEGQGVEREGQSAASLPASGPGAEGAKLKAKGGKIACSLCKKMFRKKSSLQEHYCKHHEREARMDGATEPNVSSSARGASGSSRCPMCHVAPASMATEQHRDCHERCVLCRDSQANQETPPTAPPPPPVPPPLPVDEPLPQRWGFKCPLCRKTCSCNTTLRRHMAIIHKTGTLEEEPTDPAKDPISPPGLLPPPPKRPRTQKPLVSCNLRKPVDAAVEMGSGGGGSGGSAIWSSQPLGSLPTQTPEMHTTSAKSSEGKSASLFSCETCGKVFLKEVSLEAHQRRHQPL